MHPYKTPEGPFYTGPKLYESKDPERFQRKNEANVGKNDPQGSTWTLKHAAQKPFVGLPAFGALGTVNRQLVVWAGEVSIFASGLRGLGF